MDEIQPNKISDKNSVRSRSTKQTSSNLPKTTKVLVVPEYLTDLFNHIETNNYPEAIRQLLLTHLPRNVCVLHEDDFPERPISKALQEKHDSLLEQVIQLSQKVQLARSEGCAALRQIMQRKIDNKIENVSFDKSSIPLLKPTDIPLSYRKLAKESADSFGVASIGFKNLREKANDGCKRSARVHEAIQILYRNAQTQKKNHHQQDDEDLDSLLRGLNSKFEDIGKNQDESSHLPMRIPKRRVFDKDDEIVPLSPFITPRSKETSCMAQSSNQPLKPLKPRKPLKPVKRVRFSEDTKK